MRLSISPIVLAALVLCISAANGAGRCRAGGGLKAKKPTRRSSKMFYSATSSPTDVTVYMQPDHSGTVYVNGDPIGSVNTCTETVISGTSLSKGDVIAVEASSGSNGHSFLMTVTSANGGTVHMTTGQDGWTAVPMSSASGDWKMPGYDDSAWPAAVPSGFQCYDGSSINPIFHESGASSVWAEGAEYTTIAARYVVGGRGPDCSCTPSTPGCPEDGICKNCLLIEQDGVRDCYSGWTEQQCQGDVGTYVWCG